MATPNPSPVRLSLLAVAVGIVGGIGAVVFRGLIALVHNFAFLGTFSVIYDFERLHGAESLGRRDHSRAGDRSLVVTLLVTKFAPEARATACPR